MSIATLSAAVQERVSEQRLIELTNDDVTATTINETTLNAACADAIGDFERVSGVAHDTDIYFHVSTLVLGVQFFLEDYKGRDGGIMQGRMKRFYSACENIRKRVYSPVQTNSNLERSTQDAGSLPDMDRKRNVFQCKPNYKMNAESWE